MHCGVRFLVIGGSLGHKTRKDNLHLAETDATTLSCSLLIPLYITRTFADIAIFRSLLVLGSKCKGLCFCPILHCEAI